ncbi:SH3 domain-containing protein [Microvirga sp. BT688]|uniref:SH3 domain-containing protein n=1 Tax=Microvirga sp. TaxID=1873136 RepID=UPI00168361BC|nr:SH3 domain-containing protein [Microvirga sp.]MBD2745828.1 SH3 domain-containing protein [Microvirga sp.]
MRPLIIATLALTATTGAALATADGPDFFDVRNVRSDDVLFLRERPTANSPKVGQVPHNGKMLRNEGCSAVRDGKILPDSDMNTGPFWCRVRYGPVEGWANARYLAEASEEQPTRSQARRPSYPASVAAAINTNTATCSSFKGMPGFTRNDLDLNADGVNDWVVDYGHLECDGSTSMFCGSGGCTLQILISNGRNAWEAKFEDTVREYSFKPVGGKMLLRLEQHGIACGKPGIQSCPKDIDFAKGR